MAKFDPTGVREPRPVREDRGGEIGPISPDMAGIWAKLPLHKGAAPMPWARSPPARPAWHAAAGTPSAPPQRRYRRQLRW